MNIAIAGCGYVGLSLAVVLSDLGHNITCIEKDTKKLEKLKRYESTIYEKDIEELILKNRERLFFTNENSAYWDKEVIFITVNTPEKSNGSCDLCFLYSALDDILSINSKTILVIKSTITIGSSKKIKEYIYKKNPNAKIDVVFNPEFLSQGSAIYDMYNADRIVIGADNKDTCEIMKKLYQGLKSTIFFTSTQSAEMIKYASNNFLALKISYINEIANLCEIFDADVEDVAYGMGLDKRIGSNFLKAGIGYGGSCFPKDTKALRYIARKYDSVLKTVEAAIEVNEMQNFILIKKARKYYADGLKGLNIALLGLSFKPGTSDLRNSISINIIQTLEDEGALVKCWDPVSLEEFRKIENINACFSETIEKALANTDLCMILTEWPEIKEMDLNLFNNMKTPIILDGRNCFKIPVLEKYPYIYDSIGRPTVMGFLMNSLK